MKRVAIVLVVLALIGLCHKYESTYTREVTVVSVKGEEVTVQDNHQHLWSFFSNGEHKVGQHITVVMNDNHTTSVIEDDVIEGVQRKS